METVFDFNITKAEEKKVLGYSEPKDVYISEATQETAWEDIAYLMQFRGKMDMARLYIAKTSPMTQQDFWRTITHC